MRSSQGTSPAFDAGFIPMCAWGVGGLGEATGADLDGWRFGAGTSRQAALLERVRSACVPTRPASLVNGGRIARLQPLPCDAATGAEASPRGTSTCPACPQARWHTDLNVKVTDLTPLPVHGRAGTTR